MDNFNDSDGTNWEECLEERNMSLPSLLKTLQASSGKSGVDEWAQRWGNLVLACLGLLGNSLFLLVIARHKSMKILTNIFLANLAVADNMLLAISLAGLVMKLLSFVPSRLFGCVFQVAVVVPSYTSTALVTAVALDRFYAICKPLVHRSMDGKSRNIKLSVMAWIFGVAYALLSNGQGILQGTGCRMLLPYEKMVARAIALAGCTGRTGPSTVNGAPLYEDLFKPLPYIVLVLVNAYLYARIIHSLRLCFKRRHKPGGQEMPGWVKGIRRSRVTITRMLAVNTLIYFSTILPRSIITITRYVQIQVYGASSYLLEHELVHIATWALVLINSCVNPAIYVLTNDKYKRAFQEVLLTGCGRSSASAPPNTGNAVFNVQAGPGAELKNAANPRHNKQTSSDQLPCPNPM